MKKRRILALLLAAVLVTGILSACTGSDSGQSQGATAPTDSTASTAADDSSATPTDSGVSAPGELPIVAEKTTLNVFIQQLSYHLTDVTTNTFTQELEEMTNVHLNMTVAPQDSYKEKLNLILSSGDYPEVIMSADFDGASLVKYGIDEQMFLPLNSYIDEHGFYIKQRFEENPYYREDMTAVDGNIYGIPASDSGIVGHGAVGYKLWLNESWLDALGLDRPTTTEEFKDVLTAFKTQDPNGNGVADEIPLTGAIDTWAGDIHLYLLNAFGYFHEDLLMLDKNGVFSGCANTESMKEGLRYINELYEAGLIDPACFTQNDQQLAALGSNEGDVIVGAASCGHVGMLLSINDVERSSMYTCLEPLEGPNGYRGIPFTTEKRVSNAAFVITDKCEQPEVAFKLADLFCSEDIAVRTQVGIKGKHWDDADPGTFGMDGVSPATRQYLTFVTSGEGASENDVWSWTCRLIEPNWKNTFQVVGDIYDPANYEARLYQETEKLRPYAADVLVIPPLFFEAEAASRIAQLKDPLKDYVKSAVVEFATGKKNVDTDWDTYVSDLEKLNYSEYIRLYQETYDK